jgi:predicted extracellular nuclease
VEASFGPTAALLLQGRPYACREARAAYVRDRVAQLGSVGKRSIVAADLNAFEDEDVLRVLQDGTTTLDILWDEAPADVRYSFAVQGRLQALDHILLNDRLENRLGGFRYAHFDQRLLQEGGPG